MPPPRPGRPRLDSSRHRLVPSGEIDLQWRLFCACARVAVPPRRRVDARVRCRRRAAETVHSPLPVHPSVPCARPACSAVELNVRAPRPVRSGA